MNKYDQLHLNMPEPPLPKTVNCSIHGEHEWEGLLSEKEARREYKAEGRILCTYCLLEIVGVDE